MNMETKFKETKSKKACGGCPFKRNNTPCSTDTDLSHPGGSHPFVYLGQARGPFWLPCHQDKNYEGTGSNTETVSQCRGAAIFRANCNSNIKRPKELLHLEEDKESVFANEKEFLMNYFPEMEETQADELTTDHNLNKMMLNEIYSPSPTKRFMK